MKREPESPIEDHEIYEEVYENGGTVLRILKKKSNHHDFNYEDYGIHVEVGPGGIPLGYDD